MENHQLFSEIKTIKDKTIWLLAKFPKTQDDDKLLYSYFIIFGVGRGDFDKGKKMLSKVLAIDFIRDVSTHVFVNFGSISRCRRKIQEDYPHLRGKKWVDRHKASKFFRENINNSDPKEII